MNDGIAREIIGIIAEISGYDAAEIRPETALAALEMDSIRSIELVVAIEKKYRISIRDEDISKIASVGQVLDLTGRLLDEKDD